jgi:hypothetical protein
MHGPALDSLGPLARWVGRPSRRRIGDYSVYAGQGQAVLVLPEFGGGPESTREFRQLLKHAGFAVHEWGLGVDNGPDVGLDRLLRRLEERVIDVFEVERGAVTLIGCGLSGIYAREVAKRTTPIVRQVITIGTPVRLRDPYQRCEMLRNFFQPSSGIDTVKMNRLRQRPPVPCTSIYSMTDEAVPPDLAEEPESITTENLAVPAKRHADLLLHVKTLESVTQRLAREDEEWRLFA